jgi:hypothetical protein
VLQAISAERDFGGAVVEHARVGKAEARYAKAAAIISMAIGAFGMIVVTTFFGLNGLEGYFAAD